MIDDRAFYTVNSVFSTAQSKGFVGSRSVIFRRLKKGVSTWDDLLKPPNKSDKEEMLSLIHAMDARKKAMGVDW